MMWELPIGGLTETVPDRGFCILYADRSPAFAFWLGNRPVPRPPLSLCLAGGKVREKKVNDQTDKHQKKMGGGTKVSLLLLFFGVFAALVGFSSSSDGLSVSCMMEYDNGGAPAVFESGECAQWILPPVSSPQFPGNQSVNCQFATLRGRRRYQEDGVACDLDMKLPLLGENGLKEVTAGMVAIFDGHGGKEASEMAKQLLFEYFRLHVVFQSYKLMAERKGVLPSSDDERSLQLGILKEALSKTIYDIDVKVSEEAVKNDFYSGSTANIVLLYHGRLLVANVGDTKALLISDKTQSPLGAQEGSDVNLHTRELTSDHRPGREDERKRVEAAGGSVIVRGVPRVNGVLALSRSLGDLPLRRYGVIAEPEFTGWLDLTAEDKYLVVASDGIFESLTPKQVGHLMSRWNLHLQGSQESTITSSCLSSSSLAECIVNTAYEDGSHDNLSAIVVPLR